MRRAAGGGARSANTALSYPSPEMVGSFLHKWIVLERFSRALANSGNSSSRRFGLPTRDLMRSLEMPEHAQHQFEVPSTPAK